MCVRVDEAPPLYCVSILCFPRVMAALARKEKRIPYREYKLTMMLKDALSTKTRSLVFCTMSPALEYKQQSMNTLYFGQSGMSVKVCNERFRRIHVTGISVTRV